VRSNPGATRGANLHEVLYIEQLAFNIALDPPPESGVGPTISVTRSGFCRPRLNTDGSDPEDIRIALYFPPSRIGIVHRL
jgi:hypothetical protein